MAPLTAGAILDRRFRLTVPLGGPAAASGTGTAWAATELRTGAEVAVKVLAPHLAGDMVAEASFRLAVRTITQLTSPEVTRILDYGEITEPGGFAVPYVVRELADGRSVADLLGDGPLPVEEALRVVATAADALAVAHPAGLVHLGSLGPGPAGRVLSYQAPELADGGAATPAADVYAVGVLFAACLAGAHRPASAATRDIPASLAGLWAACLAISPRDRPGAAHVAVLVRQALADIVGPRLTGTGPMAAMAASSRPAPRPAVPAARWPG
jgi:serine/threonine-protein kinase